RFVGGRAYHNRAPHPLGSQIVLDKITHLAAAFADQSDHIDVCLGVAGDHTQKRALATSSSRKQADALALPCRQHRIDSSNAERDRLGDTLSLQGIRWVAKDGEFLCAIQ